ncbi:MAG TPA: tetratricopeptide repeat protein [Micropepsaceae bacterium]|jgi:predicted TPR repeat methyltransferase
MSPSRITDAALSEAHHHFEAGRLEEATKLYRGHLRSHPKSSEAFEGLGRVCLQAGQFERAQYFFSEAARFDPVSLDALRLRGAALMQLGRHAAALDCFERALAVKPDFIEALVNRAVALFEMKRLDEALTGYDRVLALDPQNAVAWTNRGNVLRTRQQLDEAVACYDRALAIQPDLETAKQNRFYVLLELRKVSRIDGRALRETFDDISPRFDALMVDKLHYRGHLQVRTLAERVIVPLAAPLTILDLGCGTGLVGEAFKDVAADGGRLDGIDLAPRMIEAARSRGIYDDLILGDLENVLAAPGLSYDLILSADTMVYLGDLAPAFSGVARRLNPGGFYIFAVESKTGESWEQTPQNRFKHSEAYLREEGARAGLSFVDSMQTTLRFEADQPVPGLVAALRK